jgi:small ligand-binding sensory domain FIST
VKAASAIAEGPDAIDRVAHELRGAGDLFLCFVTAPLQPLMARSLAGFGGPVYGCSAFGVLGGSREIEQAPAAAALALKGAAVEPFAVSLDDSGARAGFGLAQRWPSDGVAALLFPDFASFDADVFFREFRRLKGFAPLAGGVAAGKPHATIFCGDRAAQGMIAGLVVRAGLTCEIVVTQCCEPLTAVGTVAAAENNVIQKLGSESPLEVLKSSLAGSAVGGEAARTGNIFGGLLLDDRKAEPSRGDFLVRALVGADQESGSVSIAGPAHVGDRFAFLYRNSEVSENDLSERLADVRRRAGDAPFAFGLYFDCAGRGKALYERDDVDIALIRHHLGDFPLVGFHGNGEIAPLGRRNVLHNFTGVLALFR